ncbi:MAG: uroporphyrinogen-III C-methyltransferase [Saprospiraceae bacterium]|nr:uroporphyrinogen-III C-methyltransferase [Saprospiraceae bacterium]
MKPHVSIVGAGPGDPELITLKAANAIKKAQVILYDALVNPALLRIAAPECEIIYVGKRAGQPYLPQEEIKLLMVQKAFEKGHVVRLKGGDPMIFGRGHEELDYAHSFAIETSVIPGISSVQAAPASLNIPLTHRDHAHSFWVVTATAKQGQLGTDLRLALQSSATIVILMGIKKLPLIVEMLLESGRGKLPIMIVENATLPEQRHLIGRVDTILEQLNHDPIGTPGIIVLGEVVTLHPSLAASLAENQAR